MQVALDRNAASWAYFAYQSIEVGYPLQDIQVITSRSHYIDLVHIAAAEAILESGHFPTMQSIIEIAEYTANDVGIYTTEKVVISEDGITAYINVDEIDDRCVPTVCSMVCEAIEQLNGDFGEVEFSKPMQFIIEDELHSAYH